MADIQSNIDIRIDTSSALASIKLLQAQISAFHTSMAKGTTENVVASKQLQQKLIDSINATQKFSAGIQNIKTTTESFTTALEKNKLSLGQYFKYSVAATKSFGNAFKTEMSTIDKVARERVKDLQTQYIQLGRDANGAMKAIAVRPLVLDLESLQTKTALVAQKQQILNQLLKQGSTNLLNFGKNTQWAGRQLMVGFTIPLSMAATAAAKAYMDIEKASVAIARVYGDLNTSNKEVTTMVAQIKQLAGEYTKYGIAISDTMAMAAKAAAMGKTGADLLAQVNQASKLAALGMVDQSQALDTTISLTNAFGTSVEQLSNKINFLNAVENQTVLSIEDMTVAIPKAAPIVKQLGGDVEDLAFFLTAMKEGGINASEGANALKSGLSSLINPTKASSEFLAGFGVNVKKIVEDDKGNLKKTVVDFASALDKIDPLNRARAIEMMFGKFQFSRISTLLQNVNKEGSQASKALELANMSSIQLAAISRKELDKLQSSPMYKFQKSIADLQLKIAPIGETFLKAVTPIIEKVGDFLNGFNKMGDGFKQFTVVGAAILGGLAPVLLMVIGLVANGAANIIKMFANVKAFLNKTTTESQVLGETTSYLTTEQIKAEAVAASLDQTHTKLKQTMTSETSAVIALMEAYQAANAAMAGFRVPAMPTSIGRGKKLATGGIISGPGTGTSDSIPAMLSDGEAVIPAKHVAQNRGLVQGLISGNIPGFFNGGILNLFASSMMSRRRGKGHYLALAEKERMRESAQEARQASIISNMLNRSNVSTRIPAETLLQMLLSGDTRYRNAYETGTGADFIKQIGWDAGKPDFKHRQIRGQMESLGFGDFLGRESQRPTYGSLATTSPFARLLNILFGGKKGIQFNRLTSGSNNKLDQYGIVSLIGNRGIGERSQFYGGDMRSEYIRGKSHFIWRRNQGIEFPSVYGATPEDISGIASNRLSEKLGITKNIPYGPTQIPYIEAYTKGGFDLSELSQILVRKPELVPQIEAALAQAGLSIPVKGPHKGFLKKIFGYASGGVISGAGSGTSDSIPAMVSNGEAIIPAKNVARFPALVKGLVSGKLPGFRRGKDGKERPGSGRSGQYGKTDFTVLRQYGANSANPSGLESFGDLGGIVDVTSLYTRDIAKAAGTSIGAIEKEVDGWKIANKELLDAAERAVASGVPAAEAFAESSEKFKIDMAAAQGPVHKFTEKAKVLYPQLEADLLEAQEYARKNNLDMKDPNSALALKAALPNNRAAELMTKPSDFQRPMKARSSALTILGNPQEYDRYGVPKTLIRSDLDPKSPLYKLATSNEHTVTTMQEITGRQSSALARQRARQQQEFNGTASETAQTASESKKTRKIAKDTVDGYTNELERGKKKPAATARKTTQAESDAILRNLQIRKQQAEMMGVDTAAIEKEIATRRNQIAATKQAIIDEKNLAIQRRLTESAQTPLGYGVQGPLLPGQQRVTTQNTGRVSGAVERGLNRGAGMLSRVGTGRSAGIGMAVSMGAYALAGSGGAVGNAVGQMLPFINMISMMTPILSGLLPKLVQFIPTIARFAGPVGLAITAFSLLVTGINIVRDAMTKEARERLASAKATEAARNSMSGSYESASNLLGVDVKAPLSLKQLGVVGRANAKNGKQINDITTLLQSSEFKDKSQGIGKFIDDLSKTGNAAATGMLQNYANTLKASGVPAQAIDSFIKAIQSAANKTNLRIDFASVDINTKAGFQKMLDTSKGTDKTLTAAEAADKKVNEEKRKQIAEYNKEIAKLEQKSKNGTLVAGESGRLTALRGTRNTELNSIKTSLESQALAKERGNKRNEIFGNVQNLVQSLGTGGLSIKAYTARINQYAAAVKNSKNSAAQLQAAFSQYGPEAQKAASKLGNINDQLMLMAYLSSGATDAQAVLTDINSGDAKRVKAAQTKIANFKAVSQAATATYTPENGNTGGSGGTSPKDILKDAQKAAEASKIAGDMMKAGFGPSLIDALANADKKTRDFYTTVKNGKLVLNDQGKALEKAFNAKIIQDFNNAFAKKSSDMSKQVTFQNALVMSGMKLADAQKVAADEEARTAYFAAQTPKAKQAIIDKLKIQLTLENKIKTTKQQQAEADQKALDLANAELQKKTAENKMATKQAQINTYQDALNLMSVSEDKINETYDKRSEALDKIQKAQEGIAAAQKDQLSVADALSRGDIAAAAKAAQDARANSAQKSMDNQKDALQKSRQAELDALMVSVNGKLLTRKQIEESIKTIQEQIYKIQLQELDPINEKIGALQDVANLSSAEATLQQEESGAGVVVSNPTTTPTVAKKPVSTVAKKIVPKTASAVASKSTTAIVSPPKGTTQYIGSRLATVIPAHYEGSQFIPAQTIYKSNGGMIPKYFATGGFAKGTDTVPAMLTPGEFVVSQPAVRNFGVDRLRAINNGTSIGDSVYNYTLSVNMSGSNLNPNDVAKAVMTQIRQVDAQRIRGNTF